MSRTHPALHGLTILERGWLSSNNVLIHAGPADAGAWLVDTGHACHSEQTVKLVKHALAGKPLAGILNTHLHNDHCGGNAALQRVFGRSAWVPAAVRAAVDTWDLARLGHADLGHECPRFSAGGSLTPGEFFAVGGRRWQALASPGHDPDSLMLFDADAGVLISADALWEDGFGMVFQELIGEPGFDGVEATLDVIENLDVQVVIPGHGAPFIDVAGALQRARSRLAYFRAQPQRHARHVVKALLKYDLMEHQVRAVAELVAWAQTAPWLQPAINAGAAASRQTAAAWCEGLLLDLAQAGEVRMDGALVHNTARAVPA